MKYFFLIAVVCAALFSCKQDIDYLSLQTKLESIHDEDQKYRSSGDFVNMQKADSINQSAIIPLIDKYGWIGNDKISKKASEAIFLVIQHAELDIQLKYFPLLEKAVKDGKADKQSYALMRDRILMRQGKKQIYGSQVVPDEKGNWVVHPIENPREVNARRAEMGMIPLAEYLPRLGVTWDLEAHLKVADQH